MIARVCVHLPLLLKAAVAIVDTFPFTTPVAGKAYGGDVPFEPDSDCEIIEDPRQCAWRS